MDPLSLKINAQRLNDTLQQTCSRWGAIPNSTGMQRLTLSQADRGVRDWLVEEARSLGCQVKVDEMGNIFCIRPGTNNELAPIAMGSHLDTQPAGGRYDGILGVQAGLEVLRTLHENNFQTHSPIALIDWTNEEGARFSGAMMSSGVWSQQSFSNLEVCHNTVDIDGIKMGDALKEIGYLGETKCDHRANPISAHFELHIEQGVRLENEKKTVGVVTSVQSMRWHAIRVSGTEGHAGTTPMGVRADALVSACKLITAVRDVAVSTGLGVGTVGVISSDTQSQATIPAGVDFTIDIRCSTDEMVEELYEKVFEKFDEILAEENNGSAWKTVRTWALPESIFDVQCIDSVRSAAVKLVGAGQVLEMKSAAGHDSAWTSKVVPTAMIFVPSKEGISHNPAEYTSPEHCAIGAQTLLDAVLTYDGHVKNRSA